MITILFSFLFLSLTSVTAFLLRYVHIFEVWAMFGLASGILVIGIVSHILLRKTNKLKLIPFFINAVSMGAYLRSWYIFRGFDNPLWLTVLVAAAASSILLVFVVFLLIPKINDHYGIYTLVFVLVALAVYILLVIFTQNTWVSTLGYYGIIVVAFIIGLSLMPYSETFPYSTLVWSSYSIVVCAIIIAIIVLGGDGLDGLDGGDFAASGWDSPIKKKKKSKGNVDL